MKLIIAGSRDISEEEALERIDSVLGDIPVSPDQIIEVVSGGARGPDHAGEVWARRHKISILIFPADWEKHGKAAGPIRNIEMAKYVGMDGALLPIWDGRSRGTQHMMQTAREHGVLVLNWR